MGERLPYKQRVTGSSPVSSIEPLAQLVEHLTFNQRVVGSIPTRLIAKQLSVWYNNSVVHADLAQLAEHLSCKQGVGGSNPLVGTFICGSSSVVEHHLAMVGVAGSNPVFRFANSIMPGWRNWQTHGT